MLLINRDGFKKDFQMTIKKRLRIVITGATRGLGEALVLGMSELGHEIYGCGSIYFDMIYNLYYIFYI